MDTQLDEDNYLTIQLRYDRPTELTERYYFLEMSTLQATTLIDQNRKYFFSELYSYTDDNEYLDKEVTKNLLQLKTLMTFS
ncbi:MAG: hypothetical protein HWD58_18735 [Bacteroidota bacterium]|nr:MAG: hypothetical protein HWD58_18735 [Bacteroidota bacterium]